MTDARFPDTWAPYMTWAKHQRKARWDLTGSNLLPCAMEELPGAREAMELYGRNDDGWPPLVEAVAQRFGVTTAEVATATGGSGANFLAFGALVRPGDHVLVESPGYDPHGGAARFLGAEVTRFQRRWEDRFRLDPEAVARAVTPRTRAIVITNLHNPSGAYASRAELEDIGAVARSIDAKVVVDEVYLDASFGVDSTPAARLGPEFISTSSLTKSYGLAGVRVGWLLADPDTIERCLRVRDVVDAVGSIPSETIGAFAFQHLDRLLDRARTILQANHRLMGAFVEGRKELDWLVPAGGGVAFPRLLGVDDVSDFVEWARRHHDVGVTPGSLFDTPAHFRVALAGERSVLETGLQLLGQALDDRGG
ncbi:MAG: aminotransferase class I/II-fold pyridoxal phosphate-dependent enzyme [Gemmatimonadetes bacterium]|nr:aminotransferase class I/II-fold pyridoxal phosphate-dependent enzyme [Gemmatimonadota bacterium]